MKALQIIVHLSFLCLLATATNTTNLSLINNSNISNNTYYVVTTNTTCTPGAGGDAPCVTKFGSSYCCYYSWY